MINEEQFSLLSRLFSNTVYREMSMLGRSPTFSKIINSSAFITEPMCKAKSVGITFERAFKAIKSHHARNDYIFRDAIIHNLLLGKHCLKTASILSEFRINQSKADIVILNGHATAYEIKSERDSLQRLASQINNYQKAFPKTYVICGENHLRKVVQTIDDSIGVMCLLPDGKTEVFREAELCFDHICLDSMYASLRKNEVEQILKNTGFKKNDFANTLQWEENRKKFITIDKKLACSHMTETLKQKRNLSSMTEFLKKIPKPLYSLALTKKTNITQQQRLVDALKSSMDQAIHW